MPRPKRPHSAQPARHTDSPRSSHGALPAWATSSACEGNEDEIWQVEVTLHGKCVQGRAQFIQGQRQMAQALRDGECAAAGGSVPRMTITQRAKLDVPALNTLAMRCAPGSEGAPCLGAVLLITESTEHKQGGEHAKQWINFVTQLTSLGVGVAELAGSQVHLVPPGAFAYAHLAGVAPQRFAEVTTSVRAGQLHYSIG